MAFDGWPEALRGSREFNSVTACKPNPHSQRYGSKVSPTLDIMLPTQNCRVTPTEGNLFLEMPVPGTHLKVEVSDKQDGTCNY